mgnify:CR=1 FL=1
MYSCITLTTSFGFKQVSQDAQLNLRAKDRSTPIARAAAKANDDVVDYLLTIGDLFAIFHMRQRGEWGGVNLCITYVLRVYILSNISNTRDGVSSHFQTLRKELKI